MHLFASAACHNHMSISQDFHIQELDVLERVLDNALVKFETTTL